MKVQAISIRKGTVLEEDGKLWVVLQSDILQPGKGASVVQVEMRDIRTGTKKNTRYRTQEMVEKARLEQDDYQFLYKDENGFTFMNQVTFDQIVVSEDIVGDPSVYLQDDMIVSIETFEGLPLRVTLPDTVVLTIVEADPVVKNQTASSSYKPAILDNGVKILVPPHIESGSKVVVRTEDSTYVEKYKG